MANRPTDEEFEAAIIATDTSIRGSQKRLREQRNRTAQLLKKPANGKFPFNEDIDVLNASLEAMQAVTGAQSPHFDLRADPRCVFVHVRDAIIAYGDECRQEGRHLERMDAAPRVRPDLALQLLRCMTHCNALLSDSRAADS
jgi:hypothetical protein